MATNLKRYGAYHRVSDANGRVIEAETTVTIEQAWEQIDGWGKLRRIDTSARYLDWDKTGSKMERPELDRMLEDLRAGRIDGIVVAQVDRFSRAEVGDALKVVKEILDIAPGSLALLDLGIDPATEFGEFGLTVLLALARMQWRRYKRQWATAQERATARGVWMARVPLGYRAIETGDPTNPLNGTLEYGDGWDQIREAFAIAAADGIHAAARYLQRHFPAMRWRTSDVRRVLSNRAYLGEHHAGGKGHAPITDLKVFTAAQTEPQSKRSSGDYPLSGLLSCDCCGEPIVGALQTVRGKTYRRMRCSANGCTSIGLEALEGYLRGELTPLLADPGVRAHLEPMGEQLEQLEQAVQAAEADAIAWATVGSIGLPAAAQEAGSAVRKAALEDAQARLGEIAGRSARVESLPLAHELDDPVELARGLRAVGLELRLLPGRAPVAERVVGFTFDDDEVAGMLAAQPLG